MGTELGLVFNWLTNQIQFPLKWSLMTRQLYHCSLIGQFETNHMKPRRSSLKCRIYFLPHPSFLVLENEIIRRIFKMIFSRFLIGHRIRERQYKNSTKSRPISFNQNPFNKRDASRFSFY